MTPTWWQLALLALGTYRVWRICGLDDAPVLNRVRDWIVGARQITPDSFGFRRPRLAAMIACPWCLGWWLSLAAAAAWFADARVALLVAVPFALSTVVGALGYLLNE